MRLGSDHGPSVELGVLGYEFPRAAKGTDVWTANWLDIQGRIFLSDGFEPQAAASDHQQSMDVTLSLARAEGLEVVRAYPEAQVGSMDWFLTYQNRWNRELKEVGNFGYTNAPTFLVGNRDAAARDQNYLLWGGVLLGLALTLAIRGLSDLADATLLRKVE